MAARVKRFYYVRGPRSVVRHMADGKVEGDRTYCGIILPLGWSWVRRSRALRGVCSRCQRAVR